LDNEQESVRNKSAKKDDDDKDPGGSKTSKNSSIFKLIHKNFRK
jgi:hypothetical protein